MAERSSPLIAKLRKMSRPDSAPQPEPRNKGADSAKDAEQTERCDFCSKPIPSDHRHFADLENMKFLCACEMCTILQAEKGEYHPVPQRYKYLKDFEMPENVWAQLKIPVNMAFIVYNSRREQSIAFYPSPAGATESELQLDSWETLKQKNPALNSMQNDLEGFMINRLDEPHEHYIVPIDCCYKLIGLIRLTWQGLHGGDKMRDAVREFFNDLKEKSN